MPDPFDPTSAENFVFRRRSGARRVRRYPYPVGPRRLADTLVEFATGGSWSVEDLDAGCRFEARSGQLLVIPADRLHRLEMRRGRPMRTCWQLIALEDEIGRDLFLRLPRAFVLSPAVSARASRLLAALDDEPQNDLVARLKFQRLGLELAELILKHSPAPLLPRQGRAHERVETVLRFIRDHLHESLTRSDLARQAHLSPTRFHYVFLEATGQAPMKYLMEQRIRRARQLLLSTTLSSSEIGQQCGFPSPPHFNRIFTRATGMSPLRYRAHAQQS